MLLLFRASGPLKAVRDHLLGITIPFIRASRAGGALLGFSIPESGTEANPEAMAHIRFERDQLAEENSRLRRALDFMLVQRQKSIAAPVIFFARDFGGESLTIGRGLRDGVHEGDYAISSDGTLVGRVRGADDATAKIAIAANSGEAYDAQLLPLGTAVLAKGMGAGTFSLELVPSNVPIRTGDFVALAPNRGLRGPLLGEVVRVRASAGAALQDILVAMSADAQTLSEVFIISAPTP